jgi:MoxR-like ATPase/transposase-like protein
MAGAVKIVSLAALTRGVFFYTEKRCVRSYFMGLNDWQKAELTEAFLERVGASTDDVLWAKGPPVESLRNDKSLAKSDILLDGQTSCWFAVGNRNDGISFLRWNPGAAPFQLSGSTASSWEDVKDCFDKWLPNAADARKNLITWPTEHRGDDSGSILRLGSRRELNTIARELERNNVDLGRLTWRETPSALVMEFSRDEKVYQSQFTPKNGRVDCSLRPGREQSSEKVPVTELDSFEQLIQAWALSVSRELEVGKSSIELDENGRIVAPVSPPGGKANVSEGKTPSGTSPQESDDEEPDLREDFPQLGVVLYTATSDSSDESFLRRAEIVKRLAKALATEGHALIIGNPSHLGDVADDEYRKHDGPKYLVRFPHNIVTKHRAAILVGEHPDCERWNLEAETADFPFIEIVGKSGHIELSLGSYLGLPTDPPGHHGPDEIVDAILKCIGSLTGRGEDEKAEPARSSRGKKFRIVSKEAKEGVEPRASEERITVSDLARDLGMDKSKQLLRILRDMGHKVTSGSSTLSSSAVQKVLESLAPHIEEARRLIEQNPEPRGSETLMQVTVNDEEGLGPSTTTTSKSERSVATQVFLLSDKAPQRQLAPFEIQLTNQKVIHRFDTSDAHANRKERSDKDLRTQLMDTTKNDRARFLYNYLVPDHKASMSVCSPRTLFQQHSTAAEVVCLNISEPEDQSITWEMIPELSTNESKPFFRICPGAATIESSKLDKVLVAVASPQGLNEEFPVLANLEPELLATREALTKVESNISVTYAPKDDAELTGSELLALIQDEDFDILHLICHGVEIEGGYKLLIRPEPGSSLIEWPADKLLETVKNSKLKLVVLAVCLSANGRVSPSLGIEMARQVGAAVAMNGPVTTDTVYAFTKAFYSDLLREGRIDKAMARTRNRLKVQDYEYWVPVLFMGPKVMPFDVRDVEEPGALRMPPAVAEQVGRATLKSGAVKLPSAFPSEVWLRLVEPSKRFSPWLIPQERSFIDSLEELRIDPVELREWLESDENEFFLSESTVSQMCVALNQGKNVLLVGPPGTGKTTLGHLVARFVERKGFSAGVMFTTATAEWTTLETVGGYFPRPDSSLCFRPGAFLEAIRQAKWLVVDELNRSDVDKAMGEFFTLISGHSVELPHRIGESGIRLLPWSRYDRSREWRQYDYFVPVSWRLIATMNLYDKSTLFSMSHALTRRFAVVDIDIPEVTIFKRLINKWTNGNEDLREALNGLIDNKTALTRYRPLGPAMIKDICSYVQLRNDKDIEKALAEAFCLFHLPQFDGLFEEHLEEICPELKSQFTSTWDGILRRRLGQLFPYSEVVQS